MPENIIVNLTHTLDRWTCALRKLTEHESGRGSIKASSYRFSLLVPATRFCPDFLQ